MLLFRGLIGGLHVHLTEPKSTLPELKKDFSFSAITPMQAANSLKELHWFKQILLGGGEVSGSLLHQLQSIKSEVFLGYGMTETASHIALRRLNVSRAGLDYLAVADVTFNTDARGCLVLHAPHLEIKELVTNDVVDLLDQTRFIWKGRADNVINSGGVKLYPEEVEAKLASQLTQPFFIGSLPNPKLGQQLVLFVEGDNAALLNLESLPKLMRPKQIIYLKRFVYTKTDKIDRIKTMNLFKSL